MGIQGALSNDCWWRQNGNEKNQCPVSPDLLLDLLIFLDYSLCALYNKFIKLKIIFFLFLPIIILTNNYIVVSIS